MAGKRKKSRTPRVVLVDLRQLRELDALVDEVKGLLHHARMLADDLICLKTKRKAAAKAAHETRRRNQAGPDYPPGTSFCEDDRTAIAPRPECTCRFCTQARHKAIHAKKKLLDKTEEINTLDKTGSSSPNEKDSSGEKTRAGEISQAVESVLDKSETELEKYLREGEEAALANGMCLTTHEWPPTEECDCPNCKKYNAETNNGTIVDWTLRRP